MMVFFIIFQHFGMIGNSSLSYFEKISVKNIGLVLALLKKIMFLF